MKKKRVAGCRRCAQIVECRVQNAGSWKTELEIFLVCFVAAVVALVNESLWGLALLIVPFMYSGYRVRNRRTVCTLCNGDDLIPAESAAGRQLPNPLGLPIPGETVIQIQTLDQCEDSSPVQTIDQTDAKKHERANARMRIDLFKQIQHLKKHRGDPEQKRQLENDYALATARQTVLCTGCGKELEIFGVLAGMKHTCPHCGETLIVE